MTSDRPTGPNTEEVATDWDSVYNVPRITWDSDAPPQNLPDHAVHMVVGPDEPGLLAKRMLYKPSASKTLVVSMHGALNRRKYSMPRFEWRRTLSRVDCAQLYLSDSTLELNNSIEIGWYIGTATQDLGAEYAALVRSIAVAGDYTRVVCVGSSAGGFGALALSRRVPGSVAVVFSPQVTVAGYGQLHRKALSAASFKGYTSFADIERDFGHRVNMRKLYQESDDLNYVHYVQNTRDRFHFEAHYAPFALALGVDPERGGPAAGRQVAFQLESQENGHAPPSRGSFLRNIEEAHRRYYGVGLQLLPPDKTREEQIGGL